MWKVGTLGVLLACAAIPAQGQELIFGANVGARWDSNVQNTPNGQSDFSARMGPEVRLLKEQGDLTYDFHYIPTYQAYSRFASLDDWDQLVNSTITYQLGLNTSLQFRDIFDYAPVATNFLQVLTAPTGVPLGTQVLNVIGHFNVLINSASIDLQHKWSELWSTEATATNFYYDPKIQNGLSSNTTNASANTTYAVTPRDFVGGALGFTAQQFGSNSLQSATNSYFYNVSAVWNHEFSPTWKLTTQAGPTYVQSGAVSTPSSANVPLFPIQPVNNVPALVDFKSCPQFFSNGNSLFDLCGPPTLKSPSSVSPSGVVQVFTLSPTGLVPQGGSQGSQTSLTYFANIAMTKQWETVTGRLGYSRSAGSSGVFSSSTEVDAATGSLVWTPTPVWTTSLSVIWTDQSSSQNTIGFRQIVEPITYVGSTLNGVATVTQTPLVAGLLAQQQKITINVYQWIVGLRSDYKVTKRLSVFGNFFFLNQTSSQNGGQGLNLSSLNYNSTRVDLGFHYEFDPIHL